MTVKVLFFGKLRNVAGVSERLVDLPAFPISVSGLIDLVAAADPMLAEALHSRHVRLIIDHEVIHQSDEITVAEEIAFIPSVSGG